jgi:hypothetical protein
VGANNSAILSSSVAGERPGNAWRPVLVSLSWPSRISANESASCGVTRRRADDADRLAAACRYESCPLPLTASAAAADATAGSAGLAGAVW